MVFFRAPTTVNISRWYNAIAQYPLRRRQVSFRNQPVGNQGAVQIASALLQVPRLGLEVLDLGKASIGDEGASALGQALARTTAPLHTIWLDGNDIGNTGAAALADGLAQSTSIAKMGILNNNAINNEIHMRIQDILQDPSRDKVQLGRGNKYGSCVPTQVSPIEIATTVSTASDKPAFKTDINRLSRYVPPMPSMNNFDLAQGLTAGRVFLSHTGKDRSACFSGHLCEALTKDGFEVFHDEWSLEPGTVWKPTIEDFARTCDVFLCLYSESYWKRFWCMFELDLAMRSGRNILPVFFSGARPPKKMDYDFWKEFKAHHLVNKKHTVRFDLAVRWFSNLNALNGIGAIHDKISGSKFAEVHLKKDILHHTRRLVQQQRRRERFSATPIMPSSVPSPFDKKHW
jgi:hypothetical protein